MSQWHREALRTLNQELRELTRNGSNSISLKVAILKRLEERPRRLM